MTKNLVSSNFWNWNTEGETKQLGRSPELVLPKKLGHPSWILGNIEKLRKGLLHHVEGIEI